MSLILEALKKSEAERQRQSGPTLLEVRVSKPQRRFPIWAVAVAALLLINMLLLLFFVLRRPGEAAATVAAPTPAAPPPVAALPAAPPAVPPAVTMTPAQAAPPPSMAPVASSAPLPAYSSNAMPALNDDTSDAPDNPADEQPAITRNQSAKLQHETNEYSNLPSYSEVGNLPDFRLDLHSFAERAHDRYALINMHTVHEGDTLPEGARVLAITREGVALEFRGQQFMLRPQ